MSKSKEELDALKEEVEAVNEKLSELTPEEITQVSGGLAPGVNGEPVIKPVFGPPPTAEVNRSE